MFGGISVVFLKMHKLRGGMLIVGDLCSKGSIVW